LVLLAHVFDGDRLEGENLGSTMFEFLNDRDRSRIPDVVGAGIKRESEEGDALVSAIDVVVEQCEQ